MATLAIDEAAWSSAWRTRSTAEKALLALGLLAVAVTAPHPVVPLVVLVVAIGSAVVGARVPVGTYVRALTAPLAFVLIGGATVAVTVGEAATWSLGPVGVTPETLARAGEVTARALGAVAALVLLATTTPFVDLLTGLRRLRVPEVVVDIAGLVYRMLFTLLDTMATVRSAQTARLGYANGRNARRSLGLLGSTVLAQAWQQARRLESGLAGRGYTTSLRTLPRERPVSWPFVAGTVAVLVALAVGSFAVGRVL